MKTLYCALFALLLAAHAEAACKEKRSRDPSFAELVVPDGAPRPTDATSFSFINDDVTIDAMIAKIGPPDAAQGDSLVQYIYCLADGSEVAVATHDRVVIEWVRRDGKTLYQRKKKK